MTEPGDGFAFPAATLYHARVNKTLSRAPFLAVPLVLTLVGCLRAGQSAARTAPSEPNSVVQRLATLLAPVQIQVRESALTAAENSGTREVRVRWRASSAISAGGPGSSPGVFSASSERQYAEPAPRQRSLEMAPGRILIAAVDRSGQLKSWSVILDPRILRSEGPGPDGVLTGQTVTQSEAEFFVSIPDDPQIFELRLFESRVSGAETSLAAVGSIPVNPINR